MKFAFVGVSGVLVNLVVFQAMLSLLSGTVSSDDVRIFAANACGVVVSIFTNFLLNDRWTWGDRLKGSTRLEWTTRLTKYYVSASAAAAVQLGVTSLTYALVFDQIALTIADVLEVGPTLALLTGIVCGMAINFVASHFWAFRDVEET